MSWLEGEARVSKDVENIWVVRMDAKDTVEIMHTDVFTAVMHGMMGFMDDDLKFDAIHIGLDSWCESVSDEYNSNVLLHVREWGPMVISDMQFGASICLLQTLDVNIREMAELIEEFPEEYVEHWGKKYMIVLQYQSIVNMSARVRVSNAA